MDDSLRRAGQVLLTGLKEVQLFNRDLEMKKKKKIIGWNKVRFSFLKS